jgi:hypothetical protein
MPLMNIVLLLILIYLATLYILIQIPVAEPILLLEQQYLVTPATQFCKAIYVNRDYYYYY